MKDRESGRAPADGARPGFARKRSFVVPVFLPAGPARARLLDPPPRPLERDLAGWKERAAASVEETLSRRKGRPQLGLFGATFGSLPDDAQREVLEFTQRWRDRIESLRVTLDPGEVSEPLLARLADAGVSTVELDVGSLEDEALATCGFSWRVADAVAAFRLLEARGFETGLILRPGMPGGTPAEVLRTAKKAAEMGARFVRIYPVLVLAGTVLADAFESRRYRPLSLEEAVETCAELLRLFDAAGVSVSRVGFQPAVDLEGGGTVVAGPWHPSLRALAEAPIWMECASKLIAANFRFQKQLTLVVAPSDETRIRGPQGSVLRRLREKFRLEKLHVRVDDSIEPGSLALELRDTAEGAVRRVAG